MKNTIWKFNPPYGLHFGGAWERFTQNAKRIIWIILGSKRPTSDVFHTIMVGTESMLNSRHIKHVADVPDNELADIESMFMQIAIKDQSALCFLWSKSNFIIQYKLTRLIYGVTCSPSMVIFVLNQCAKDNGELLTPYTFGWRTRQRRTHQP